MYDPTDYSAAAWLVANSEHRTPIDLWQRTVAAVFLTYCLTVSLSTANAHRYVARSPGDPLKMKQLISSSPDYFQTKVPMGWYARAGQ